MILELINDTWKTATSLNELYYGKVSFSLFKSKNHCLFLTHKSKTLGHTLFGNHMSKLGAITTVSHSNELIQLFQTLETIATIL